MRFHLLKETSGAAAVEMALVTPLLMTLMFGSFELGNYFLDNHIVAKAVRDGARFASRQGFGKYQCPASTVDNDTRDKIRNVTRTNQIDSGGNPRLGYWSSASTISVTVRCDTSGSYGSFYEGMAAVPVVTVTATVPYTSLFSSIGFNSSGLILVASSEAPVMGV